MPGFDQLCSVLEPTRPVVVQAHDFPDHDAVGAAFGLSKLLEHRGYTVTLCYGGGIQSESLRDAIREFGIVIVGAAEARINEHVQIVVVDGFVGNSNITALPGSVIGVIDHHPPPTKSTCVFSDIRPGYGSCSTILYEYFQESQTPMDEQTASALLMGLMMDTAFMTRGVSRHDMDAFSALFFRGNWQLATRLLKNSLSLGDLAVFREAIDVCTIARDFGFIPLQSNCSNEVMALVADYFLSLREVHFVVVVSGDRYEHRISVRSEDAERPCDIIVSRALAGIGSGGGHIHMGGGSIPLDLYPGDEGLRKRFLSAMGFDKDKNGTVAEQSNANGSNANGSNANGASADSRGEERGIA